VIETSLARRIALVCFDVDGTLTDNGIYVGRDAQGQALELKKFDVQDGLAITLLHRTSIAVAFISARDSSATTQRANELRIRHLHQGRGLRKLPVLQALCADLGIGFNQVAFVGDDLADIPVMKRVGLPVAPSNSAPEVKAIAALTLTRPGGQGAAREFIEVLLHARGEWTPLVEAYVADAEREAVTI
jgi:3-deoxy-D-manno-octulosonate 8-phosphate phosphatase (KDO 8-P phosphatase)